MVRVAAAALAVLAALPHGTARASDDPPAPEGQPEVAAVATQTAHRYFRFGLRGFGLVDHFGEDAAKMPLGVGAQFPLTMDFHRGLGMKVAFTAGYFQNIRYEVEWGAPGDPAGVQEHVYEGSDNRLIYYGATIAFNYEVNVPNEPFFKVCQPFVSIGVAILVVRTHPDVPPGDDALITNDYYQGPDAKGFDPWSLQARPALDLSWGFHMNAAPAFRFVFDFGYRLIQVPAADLQWATEGYGYRHLDYVVNTFNFGGGLEWLF